MKEKIRNILIIFLLIILILGVVIILINLNRGNLEICDNLNLKCDEHTSKCDNLTKYKTNCLIIASSCNVVTSLCILNNGKGEIVNSVFEMEELIERFWNIITKEPS